MLPASISKEEKALSLTVQLDCWSQLQRRSAQRHQCWQQLGSMGESISDEDGAPTSEERRLVGEVMASRTLCE